MKEMRVLFERRSGVIARALRLGNPGRGIHQLYGQWGSGSPPIRAPLGASIPLSRRPRNRMGLHGVAREYARHQLERNVYRIRRSALGGGRIFRAIDARQAGKIELFCEAGRARARNGRVHSAGRRAASRGVSRAHQSSFGKSALTTRYSFCDD